MPSKNLTVVSKSSNRPVLKRLGCWVPACTYTRLPICNVGKLEGAGGRDLIHPYLLRADINECESDSDGDSICPTFSDCVNTYGAYECICITGTRMDESGNCTGMVYSTTE